MTESKVKELMKRYTELAHAVQSGVKWEIELDPLNAAYTSKHLRTGVNLALVDSGALGYLLVKKGLITEEELWTALVDGMQQEVQKYESRLSTLTGKIVTLE